MVSQRDECVPVVSRATIEELISVLRYPKFALDATDQEALLIAYLPYCETLANPKTRTPVAQCRDADDQALRSALRFADGRSASPNKVLVSAGVLGRKWLKRRSG